MKNFSYRIFFIATFAFIILNIACYIGAFAVSDSGPDIGLFWIILAKSFFVFNWAFVLIIRIIGANNPDTLFAFTCIFLNCLLDGFIIERIFSLRKKKSKFPPVPTRI
jgi:hypothetical protein